MTHDVNELVAPMPAVQPYTNGVEDTTETLLQIENLQTHFFTRRGVVKVLDGLNLHLKRGQILGLVGESGSASRSQAFRCCGWYANRAKSWGARLS
ncbi:MAG: hypothetical protein HC914_20075 [Chloroflexaceae bacterium]|nr:hypothetical protein [Chloroflexaceae bacterium]